jgi:hypothetical protein
MTASSSESELASRISGSSMVAAEGGGASVLLENSSVGSNGANDILTGRFHSKPASNSGIDSPLTSRSETVPI